MVFIVSGGRDPEVVVENPLKEIDGDFRKVRLIDANQDDGLPLGGGNTFSTGRPVAPEHMPTRLRRGGPSSQPLLDVLGGYGQSLLVAPPVRRLIEEMEPETHQFFPMSIEQRGKVRSTHALVVVCNRLDTLHREQCVPPPEPGRPYRPDREKQNRVVFSSEKIGSHKLWRDKFVRGLMISDDLWEAVTAAGFRGLSERHYAEA